jgi:hypothetical protein
MLLPRSRTWTPLQKRLIIGAAVVALALCGVGVYTYERYYRVTDSVLVGTWAFPALDGDEIYFRLDADHTFRAMIDPAEQSSPAMRGIWFGGGNFLYMRQPFRDEKGNLIDDPLLIWRLENISENELRIRLNPGGIPRIVRRVSAPSR